MRRSTRETTMASSSGQGLGHGQQDTMAPKKQQRRKGKSVAGAGRGKPVAPCTCQLEADPPSHSDISNNPPSFDTPSTPETAIDAPEDARLTSSSTVYNGKTQSKGKTAAVASRPRNSGHNAAHPPPRRSRRTAASKVAIPPSLAPSQYLASSSSVPWSVRVNNDASRASRAFAFPADASGNTVARGVWTPADHPLLLAPFLFDSPDILDKLPIDSNARRSSSLPARLTSPMGTSSTLESHTGKSVPTDLQDWLLCTSPAAIEPSADGPTSYTSSSSSANSRFNSGSSNSNSTSSSANTAATSQSSKSRSNHSSPTSSQEGCCSSRMSDIQSHNVRSSPSASKRPSDALMEEVPKRLKKLKLSHRIRSFLLLRPPGLPLTGTDGAADIAHIMKAPAWLKNATSELSRESRMAPNEWVWSCNGHNPSSWIMTTIERKFRNLLKSNKDREDLEREERDGLSPDMPIRIPPYMKTEKNSPLKLEEQDDSHFPPTSPLRNRAAKIRPRRVSAPPNMEANPQPPTSERVSPPLPAPQATTSAPPEVLKSQLLAVLRSRLPEGAKNGDAPLRMKKFVVWNAWIRRATLSTSRSRYRRRSLSPEASAPLATDTSRNGVSLSPPPTQVPVLETLIEPVTIDTSLPSLQLFEEMDQRLSESSGKDTYATEDPNTTALGLMMHDETARTARRFSRAFESDGQEDISGMDTDILGSHLVGPFISPSGTSEDQHTSYDAVIPESDSLLFISPSPVYSGGGSKYSGSHYSFSRQYPIEDHRYSSMANTSRLHDEEEKQHNVDERPMSPLRARMELQASTLTPPSFSADLAGDNYVIPPLHYNYNVTVGHSEDQTDEDATIVPFWFDRESVTFDDDDHEEQQTDEENEQAYVQEAEIITVSQDLAKSTSGGCDNVSSDDWPQTMRTEIAA